MAAAIAAFVNSPSPSGELGKLNLKTRSTPKSPLLDPFADLVVLEEVHCSSRRVTISRPDH
jgi:hypothetical protein